MPAVPTFPARMAEAGYFTAVNGKWHLGNSPESLGFQWADVFEGNGAWYNRAVREQGRRRRVAPFIERCTTNRPPRSSFPVPSAPSGPAATN